MINSSLPRPPSLPEPTQMVLFDGGYPLLTVELVWHLDGKNDTLALGYGIRATDTNEQVELATLGILSAPSAADPLGVVTAAIHERALRYLAPF